VRHRPHSGDVGGYRGDFGCDPHADHERPRELFTAQFRQIAPGDDAELRRHGLEQHGDQVGDQHHPQQLIAVGRAGLDIGGEIAWVHITHRRHDRRPGERQQCADAFAASVEHVARGEFGPLRRAANQGEAKHGIFQGRAPTA